MKLDAIIENPSGALNYMERFVNNGSNSGFTWVNTTSEITSPLSEVPFFYLYVCNCPETNTQIYGNFPKFFKEPKKNILSSCSK